MRARSWVRRSSRSPATRRKMTSKNTRREPRPTHRRPFQQHLSKNEFFCELCGQEDIYPRAIRLRHARFTRGSKLLRRKIARPARSIAATKV